MKRALLWAVLVCGIGSIATAEEAAFRYSRDLNLPALQQEELVAVPLDSEVYANTELGLPDIRILDKAGNEVSFLSRKATTKRVDKVRRSWRATKPTVHPLEGGGLEIIVSLEKDDPQPGGIRIVSPLRNFQNRVQVFASSNGQDWQSITEDGLIFDYSQYMDVDNDTVDFGELGRATADSGDLRHFRIVIDDVTAEQESELLELTRRLRGDEEIQREEKVIIRRRPFRIDQLEFWRDERIDRTTGDKRIAYPIEMTKVENVPADAQTIVALKSQREPLTSFKLKTPTHNFSRRARVQVEQVRGTNHEWRTIGEATISRLDFRDLNREELAVSFPESRESQYRMVIENRNSPPLAVDGIEGEGSEYELVFLADPQATYRLTYGDADATGPIYDIAAVRASLDAGYQPVVARLGKQIELTGATEESGWSLMRLVNNAWLLGGVIVLLVAALGWGLYRATRRLGTMTDE